MSEINGRDSRNGLAGITESRPSWDVRDRMEREKKKSQQNEKEKAKKKSIYLYIYIYI